MLESWFLIGEGILYQVISCQSYRNLINEGHVHKIITLQTNKKSSFFIHIFVSKQKEKEKKKNNNQLLVLSRGLTLLLSYIFSITHIC